MSSPIWNRIIGSFGSSQESASSTLTKRGSSMAGMPSLGGPPESTWEQGTLCLEKSVANSASAPSGGSSSGPSAAEGRSADRAPPERPSPPRAPQAPARKARRVRAATTDDERLILLLLVHSTHLSCMGVTPMYVTYTTGGVRHLLLTPTTQRLLLLPVSRQRK